MKLKDLLKNRCLSCDLSQQEAKKSLCQSCLNRFDTCKVSKYNKFKKSCIFFKDDKKFLKNAKGEIIAKSLF